MAPSKLSKERSTAATAKDDAPPTVNASNLGDVSHAFTDSLKRYLVETRGYTESHKHGDTKLLLGWAGVFVACASGAYGHWLAPSFAESKTLVGAGVALYTLLSIASWAYAIYVEQDIIFVGKRKVLAGRITTEKLTVRATAFATPKTSTHSSQQTWFDALVAPRRATSIAPPLPPTLPSAADSTQAGATTQSDEQQQQQQQQCSRAAAYPCAVASLSYSRSGNNGRSLIAQAELERVVLPFAQVVVRRAPSPAQGDTTAAASKGSKKKKSKDEEVWSDVRAHKEFERWMNDLTKAKAGTKLS